MTHNIHQHITHAESEDIKFHINHITQYITIDYTSDTIDYNTNKFKGTVIHTSDDMEYS